MEVQLSKWWRTPSAQAAIARSKNQIKERLAQVKAESQARKETLEREVQQTAEEGQ